MGKAGRLRIEASVFQKIRQFPGDFIQVVQFFCFQVHARRQVALWQRDHNPVSNQIPEAVQAFFYFIQRGKNFLLFIILGDKFYDSVSIWMEG